MSLATGSSGERASEQWLVTGMSARLLRCSWTSNGMFGYEGRAKDRSATISSADGNNDIRLAEKRLKSIMGEQQVERAARGEEL